jgi:hypothetical protein
MKIEISASPILDTVKGTCLFAVLGPPLGLLGFSLYFAVCGAVRGDLSAVQGAVLFPALAFVTWIVAFSAYLFGLVPAAACGLICGPFRPAFRSWSACFVVGAIGGLLSAFWNDWQFGRPHEERILFFVSGFFAGCLCARLFAVRAPATDRSSAS